jgi:predicted transcriptional regulator
MPLPALLPDLRRPGQPMAAIPVKLPAAAADALQEHADRIGASRSAVARHLIVAALDLEVTATA